MPNNSKSCIKKMTFDEYKYTHLFGRIWNQMIDKMEFENKKQTFSPHNLMSPNRNIPTLVNHI